MAKGAAQEGKAPAGTSPRLPAGRHGLPREFIEQNALNVRNLDI